MNKIYKRVIISLSIILFIIIGFIIGFFTNSVINEENVKCEENYIKNLDGLLLRNYKEEDIKNYTNKVDKHGDWVCVNIRDMEIERALEVCRHEVGHEIFAEYCEQSNESFNKCMKITKK